MFLHPLIVIPNLFQVLISCPIIYFQRVQFFKVSILQNLFYFFSFVKGLSHLRRTWLDWVHHQCISTVLRLSVQEKFHVYQYQGAILNIFLNLWETKLFAKVNWVAHQDKIHRLFWGSQVICQQIRTSEIMFFYLKIKKFS